jgi:NADPH:quinone reductase-like Zn-dependent oxidoreductase
VVVAPGLSCGRCPRCLAGDDNLCRDYKILGFQVDGGYAEYVVVPAQNLLPKPGGLSFEEAAAVPLTFLTAWNMLVQLGRVRAGEWVLVIGGGSGVGSAAIQIAKLHGARVVATVGASWKAEKARELGADEVVYHTEPEFHRRVWELTGGIDLVVEHAGAKVWPSCLKSLKRGGRMVFCGATTGREVSLDIRPLYVKQIRLLGAYMGRRETLHTILPLVAERRLRAVIDKVYPLEAAAEAHRRMEQRQHFGKIVLTPP